MFKNYLREWGLENYVEKFEEEEIDDESFSDLTSDIIRSIFTKAGPYCKFLKQYNAWKCCTNNISSNNSSVEECIMTECGTSHAVDIIEIEPLLEGEEGFYNLGVDGSLIKDLDIDASLELSSTPKQDSPLSLKRKLAAEKDFPIIKEGFIHEALRDNYNGTLAIFEYKNFGFLSAHNQQQIAECVLLHEIKGNIEKKISAARFSELANQIEEYFPKESAFTYYIPYHKDRDNRKHSASGKLIDLLYNIRRRATRAGIRNKPTKLQFVDEITSEGDLTESEEIKNLVNSLKISCSPWQEYVQKWADTHKYRLYYLQKISSINKRGLEENKVSSYLKELKGLKEPLGYTLLELDYKHLYPGSENNLLGFWPVFKRNLVNTLNSTLKSFQFSEDDSDAKVLMNISSLVKPKLIVDKLSQKWKPTREVIQEGFMIHVTSLLDLDSGIQRYRDRAAARKETAQPVTVIVGSLDQITDTYVILDDLQYKLDSPVKALDLNFKLFHAIHAEYPKHAEPLWLILQLGVYNIKTKWDNLKALKAIEPIVKKLSCF